MSSCNLTTGSLKLIVESFANFRGSLKELRLNASDN